MGCASCGARFVSSMEHRVNIPRKSRFKPKNPYAVAAPKEPEELPSSAKVAEVEKAVEDGILPVENETSSPEEEPTNEV